MPEEVKPKRRRRRRLRSRKKKALQTVESFNPERAPLGFYHSFHYGSPGVAAHASESRKGRSPQQKDSPSRNLDSLLWASATTPSPNSVNGPPSLRCPSDFAAIPPIFHHSQDVDLASAISRVSPSVDHQALAGKDRDASTKRAISPATVSHRHCHSTMAGQRLPFRPYARELLTYDFLPPAARPGSVDSLDDLVSSRPIPLSALSSRANSRNKGVKAWKPLQLDDDEGPKSRVSSMSISDASQCNQRPQLPSLHNSSGDDSVFKHYQDSHTTRPPFYPLERGSEDTDSSMGQSWMKSVQRNPLSNSSGYGFPSHDSFSQHPEFIPERPFLETDNYVRLESPGWFENGRHMSSGRPSGGIHSHYPLLFPGEKLPMQETSRSSRAYEYEISNPYVAYPELPQQHRPSSQMNICRSVSTMRYSLHESQVQHGNDSNRLGSEDVGLNGHGRILPGPAVLSGYASQMQISDPSRAQATNTVHPLKTADANLNSDAANSSRYPKTNDSREEVAAYLKSVVQASEMNIQPAPLSDPFVDTGNPLKEEYQTQRHTDDSEQSLLARNGDSARVSEEILSITRKLSEDNEAFKLLCAASIPERTPPSVNQEDLIYGPMGKPEALPSVAVGKILRPPLGLAGNAAAHELEHTSLCRSPEVQSTTLEEANRWFHMDNRGEEELREQVADIAQCHAEEYKKLKGTTTTSASEIETVKQRTLLLGNIIANLQSYVSGDRKEQAKNFADFSSVPDHFCEAPDHSSRRSYFERDQLVGQSFIPADWSFPAFGGRSEKKIVLDKFHGSSMSDGWDAHGNGV